MNNQKIDNKTISNSQLNKKHVKKPNIWISGKDHACTSTIELLLMMREYDTINEFPLFSQKLNPSYDNRGFIYTKYGLLMSLKLLTNYILHDNVIEHKYH